MMNFVVENINFIGAIILFIVGLYMVLTHPNLIKKIIGINIMETSVFLFFISIAYVRGGQVAIIMKENGQATYMNPLPSAIVLAGIVVTLSITAYALSIIVKIKEAYGTIEYDEIVKMRGEEND